MIIPVGIKEHGYNITLSRGALSRAGEILNLNRKALVVTDSGVPTEYSDTVASVCKTAVRVCLPQGEASKCFEKYKLLLSKMLEADFTRSDCVIAVGGGVVGDLCGFAASCYMRGIDFYNIPTTLLSQIDSSVGGKTAIDFGGVKNVVGSFYQPNAVLIDPNVLKTLEARQLHSGLAEAIKMSLTSDAELFTLIENSDDLNADIDEIIRRSLIIKRDVVEKDPQEKELRRVLNFGHTIGHAVESFNCGKLLHGECVAIGMPPMCSDGLAERVVNVLKKYDLPYSVSESSEQLLPYIVHDKKMKEGKVTAVTVQSPGEFAFEALTPEEITQRLER